MEALVVHVICGASREEPTCGIDPKLGCFTSSALLDIIVWRRTEDFHSRHRAPTATTNNCTAISLSRRLPCTFHKTQRATNYKANHRLWPAERTCHIIVDTGSSHEPSEPSGTPLASSLTSRNSLPLHIVSPRTTCSAASIRTSGVDLSIPVGMI